MRLMPISQRLQTIVEAGEKNQILENGIRVIKGSSAYGMEMCLVPKVVMPPKFKTPDFQK